MENNRKTVCAISAAGFLVFVYVAVRAYLLSFTWDESYTFLTFVRNGFLMPDKAGVMEANNHLLNTWLMKLMSAFFGNSEFSLRLPNVLAYLLYAFYSAKIALKYQNSFFAFFSFLLLNLNPFLLDFFSLARGYGMSMGFMMGSLFYLLRFVDEKRTLYAFVSVLFASLSVLAHLTMMNYLLVLSALIFFLMLFRYEIKNPAKRSVLFLRDASFVFAIPLALLFFIMPYYFKLRDAGAFYYGGHDNFWNNTVINTIKVFLYDIGNFYLKGILKIFVLLTVCFSGFLILRDFLKRSAGFNHSFTVVFFLITAIAASTILQHRIFSTLYLEERTALLFIPLFSLLLLFLINRLSQIKPRLAWATLILAVLLCIHFFYCMNFYFVQQWREDADVKAVVEYLEQNRIPLPPERENSYVGMDFIYCPETDYYRATRNLSWLNASHAANMLPAQDYYLLPDSGAPELKKNAVEMIARFPAGATLYRNLKKPLASGVLFQGNMDFETPDSLGKKYTRITDKMGYNSAHCSKTDPGNESTIYSDGFDYAFPDSLPGITVLASFKAMVNVSDKYFNAIIVFQLDSAGKAVFWQSANVRDNIQKPEQWQPVIFTAQLPYEIKQGEHLKAYLWNMGTGEVFIDDLKLKIIGYKF